MKIADEIKSILDKVAEYGYLAVDTVGRQRLNDRIDQALKEILKLKVKLPAKKSLEANMIDYEDGYNQALEDATKLNEE